MQELNLDTGLKEYAIGGGVLRFNPSDPNLYHRFLQTADRLEQLEQELCATEAATGEKALELLKEGDKKAKALLSEAFGQQNDFDKVTGGVNLLAVCQNGRRLVQNLLEALAPVLEQGVKGFYDEEAQKELARLEE